MAEVLQSHIPKDKIVRSSMSQTDPPSPTRALRPSPYFEVSCEMNISKWEKALEAAGILPEYQDVIKGVKHGFHQGIPEHDFGRGIPYFAPPDHEAALLAKEKIESSITKEIQAKRMFGPFTTEQLQQEFKFFRTNPLSAVVNGAGSVRPVNDLSYPKNIPGKPSVNSFVDKLEYETTWDDFETVSRFFRQ
ncbi:hypothetical protein PSTG_01212 [Puccinia striiformis f. sp. tritici PST-78]|uniref:Uncharacterized protein n=1 Tax=Puccinia striiformis f. sp. tritici PST-78 TaxID=1165861 RepID=A0A0L0W3D3_9BASI|nr:hypothetical protein PSTG_01212 [Puccinia striiformis f. sp. tritici PST-78]